MPSLNAEKLAQAKSPGFSDRQIAHLTGTTEDAVRAGRKRIGLAVLAATIIPRRSTPCGFQTGADPAVDA